MSLVRIATQADLPAIVAIYNQAIAAQNATPDTTAFTVEERLDWFGSHSADEYPIYVCEGEEGRILGWLSLSPYRERPALSRTAEISYYVDYAFHDKGIGSALMQHAIAECPRLGKQLLLAILLERNTPSIKLLEKFGFKKWGFLPEVAELPGGLCGHLYYGRKDFASEP